MSNRPAEIKYYNDVDLKLGIKSSLPHVKSTLALSILFWECMNKCSELLYSQQNGDEIIISDILFNKFIECYSSLCPKEEFEEEKILSLINNNQLFKSQLEALIVAFELVWKLAKVNFVDETFPASMERTGGKRYPKILRFSTNIDIIDTVISTNKNEYYKVLLSWIGINLSFEKIYEDTLIRLFSVFCEDAIFKLVDKNTDVIFNLNSIYSKLIEESQPVDINGDKEAKGSLRILKSLIADDLNPYIDSHNGLIVKRSGTLEDLASYQKRVDVFLQLNSKKIIKNKENEKKLPLYTPEWFQHKANEEQFKNIDKIAEDLYIDFRRNFSPDKLEQLRGKDVITTIFLNNENNNNLCHELEYNKDNIFYFGSIRNGNAFKYGLHYSPKKRSWMTGSHINPETLTEEEAIILGTKIRDALLKGYEIIKNTKSLDTVEDYLNLYQVLDLQTEGYINKIWFMKYYFIMFPNIFSNFYSQQAQISALQILGINPGENSLERNGQLVEFIKDCGISSVLFSRIFHTYCNKDIDQMEESIQMKNCLEIKRNSRKNTIHPLNFIIYGAPGTGKTYSTVEYATAIIENREVDLKEKNSEERKNLMVSYENYVKKEQIVFTTFHQNYSYEDFIQGLRPDTTKDDMSFSVVDGIFKHIADKALNDMENNYVIIIDEINRANISKVFGELITLIEEDKRWGEINEACTTLPSGDKFAVPNNLYIIGTMNSADKSISLIDAALRRRFEFIEQKPNSDLIKDTTLKNIFKKLNIKLVNELDSTDLLIGHSYFLNKTRSDLCKIFNNSVIPLLYEYFYDNKKKVRSILDDVLKDTGIEVVDEKVCRLCVKEGE